MKVIRKMPGIEELRREYALTDEQAKARAARIGELEAILAGRDKRKIVCIGPCSADREDAVLEYMERLTALQEQVRDKLLLVPRVYTGKPRTTGSGYKGLLHRPHAREEDNLAEGVKAVRCLHLRVIQQTGLFAADEMLYPELFAYFSDLLCYAAVGARSVEDQGHRLAAGSLSIPVGMKNPMSGELTTLMNSIRAAQLPQSMVQQGYEIRTDGNPYAHAILRGYVDHGANMPNYHYETLCTFHDMLNKSGLSNIGVVIDCNHSNSDKNPDEQPRIAREVFGLMREDRAMAGLIKGLMVESYLQDGKQLEGGTVYGKSVTDACLGWDKTKKLLYELAESSWS